MPVGNGMSNEFFLLPRTVVASDPENARAFLKREARHFADEPAVLDPAIECRKRKLVNLLLQLKPEFRQFNIRWGDVAEFEKISLDEARRKYRQVQIDGSGIQFTVFDRYVHVTVYSKFGKEELDAILAALSPEGDFVVFDPQTDRVIDLREQSLA
jgi:hypothetical protein